ncbi:MAG: GNAT family N-acetyltransferase [Anaerosomatales bacterium]|nr:GNAT family N-acetyltransferase [Anaerosomatales bacterium]MDT8435002.1 GNAT family N-acetyltransferase [Anaerosomatales bacterium]
MLLRPARPNESELLSELACAAKAHWGYPPDLMALWADELGVSPEFIEQHHVICAGRDGKVVGFAAVCGEDGAFELEHLWIHPGHMREGVGRALVGKIAACLQSRGTTTMRIVSDPHAEVFYLALGARRVGEKESTKRPGRFLPVLVLDIEPGE